MKYSFTSRIRYSEIGEDGNLTLPGLINYFQDCSTFQSEAIGEGVAELKKRGCAWVLSAWQIHVRRYPSLGEAVKITTWASGFKGFLGMCQLHLVLRQYGNGSSRPRTERDDRRLWH